MTAVVTAEPRVYGPDSDASYFQDIALTSPGVNVAESDSARDRLFRYAAELDAEINAGTPEGRHAERASVEFRRNGGVESRAASSRTLAGFTTPVYLIGDWAGYHSPATSFLDQTTNLPLPTFGLQVNIPSFTSTTSFGTQTENSGVADTDPTGADLPTSLVTQAGEVVISQQLADRGGLPGMAFDQILLKQMKEHLDSAVDRYVLAQALANAGSVSDSGSGSITALYTDLAKAREILADTQGTRMLATHLFSTSDLFGWATRQVDSQMRPILSPDSSALVLAAQMNDPMWNSWTGIHMGQLRWHTDDSIPASGSNTQIIVARPSEIFTFDGDPVSFAYPQTYARSLSVVVGLRSYVAAVVRFPKAIATISGAAYPTSLV